MSTTYMSPLPPNYGLMTPDEQRAARLAAMEMQMTPADTVRAWSVFHNYHMSGQRKRDVASPRLHYEWVYACATWARNMIAAPRSFAKSTIVGKEWPLFLALTRPNTEILIVVSTDLHARQRGQWFLTQLSKNQRLQEDFGDMRGSFKSEGRMWNYHGVDLHNGSRVVITSAGAIHLGARPDVIIMDDVEPDPQKVKNWTRVVEELDSALFDVFLPMLDAGTSMVWIGTLLHRRSFLYWCMTTADARLQFWHRMLSAIEDKNGVPQWPEKFPAETIARLKQELRTKFWAQFMNEPISDEAAVLRLHPKRNMYHVVNRDDAFALNPLESKATLVRWRAEHDTEDADSASWVEQTVEFGRAVAEMYRFMTVDYAVGLNEKNDFSAMQVLGDDTADCLWSLDMWCGRDGLDGLCRRIEEMAYRWRVALVAIESVGGYRALYEHWRRKRPELEAAHGWIPRLMKVNYPAHLSKPVRIAGLEWRVNDGKLMIPAYDTPHYVELRREIANFTMDGAAMQHDDAVDTLAMQGMVLRPKVKGLTREQQKEASLSLAQRLVKGDRFDPVLGVPYASGLSADQLPFKEVREAERRRRMTPKERSKKTIALPEEFRLDQLPQLLGLK